MDLSSAHRFEQITLLHDTYTGMRQAHELRPDQFVHAMKVLRQFTALTHLALVVHDDKY
jgi:hypothetical protein